MPAGIGCSTETARKEGEAPGSQWLKSQEADPKQKKAADGM